MMAMNESAELLFTLFHFLALSFCFAVEGSKLLSSKVSFFLFFFVTKQKKNPMLLFNEVCCGLGCWLINYSLFLSVELTLLIEKTSFSTFASGSSLLIESRLLLPMRIFCPLFSF